MVCFRVLLGRTFVFGLRTITFKKPKNLKPFLNLGFYQPRMQIPHRNGDF